MNQTDTLHHGPNSAVRNLCLLAVHHFSLKFQPFPAPVSPQTPALPVPYPANDATREKQIPFRQTEGDRSMMKNQGAWVLALAVGSLVSCATVSHPISQLKPVPPERVTWSVTALDPAGTLVVARDAGFAGSGARVSVAIDGKPAVVLWSEEVALLQVPPGRIVVTASAQAGLGGELYRPRSLEVTISPNAQTLLRIGFDDGRSGFSIWQDVAK